MDLQPFPRGEREQLQETHRFGPEEIIVGNRDAPAIEREAAKTLGLAAYRRKREPEALFPELLIKLGKEHAGEIAHGLRVEEVELHEALDRGLPRAVGVMHDFGDARLIVEVEPFFGTPRKQVQVTAHRPEKALGAVEPAELGGGQQARADEVRRALHAVHIFADPVEGMEVAQAALAVLDVGLDDIAAVAHLDVALVPLSELGSDEIGGGPGDHFLAKAAHGRVEQRVFAPNPSALEEGGADRHVLFRKRDQLGD